MMRTFLSIAVALVVSAWASTAMAQPDFSPVAQVLERAVEERAFPGCTVAVGTDEELLWSAAFGHLDYQNKKRVTPETIYDLASLTKVAGTTAVFMRLVQMGKVRVTDRASKYLPEYMDAARDEEEKSKRGKITIERMLTHTAGLPSWKPFYRSVTNYSELLGEIYKVPLDAEPGERYRYSDPGMILLGEIAARAGGKPLAELERELVFEPLKMKETLRNPPGVLRPRIAPTERLPGDGDIVHGVVHDENARAGEGITGHAGLFSTVADLSRLAAELLRALDGRSEVFSKEVVTDFIRERSFSSNRALGWGIGRDPSGKSQRAISHTGFTGTSMWIDPERKFFVILLTNRVHPTRNNDKISRVRTEVTAAAVMAFDASVASGSKPARRAAVPLE
jgi:beta-N-acetylhexosaminidase